MIALRPLIALLGPTLAVLLFASTTARVAHVHLDGRDHHPCAVCVAGSAAAVLNAQVAPGPPAAARAERPTPEIRTRPHAAPARTAAPRAPPLG